MTSGWLREKGARVLQRNALTYPNPMRGKYTDDRALERERSMTHDRRLYPVLIAAALLIGPPLGAQAAGSVADTSHFRALELPAPNEYRTGSGDPGRSTGSSESTTVSRQHSIR
jgi:hypothetical protein